METLTLGGSFTVRPDPALPVDSWVLLVAESAPEAPRAALVRRSRAAPKPMAQDLVWLRDWLLFAYLAPTDYRETDRPPEADGVGVVETDRLRDAFPRYRANELGECPLDGCEDTKRLPFDYVASLARGTTRVSCSETRKKKKSAIPLGPTAFEDARLIRSVATLEPEQARWVRYAYGDSLVWDDEAGCVVALWQRSAPQLGKMQGKSLQRAKGLAHLAVQHHKRLKNAGTCLHAGPDLARLLGVTDVNYRQHWAPRWAVMQSELDKLDVGALEALWLKL
ncbi:bacteriophage antitermination protein Q [Pseudomonas viridiflava]|uniref:bacteriophage antitermination protein Q n=1 Tax=Pseudomonas viridiflava TaxID=33069 RepID=UPI000F03D0B8|nr:bacteriophage antitermination protein Q [Pseudomonas viridiflava]